MALTPHEIQEAIRRELSKAQTGLQQVFGAARACAQWSKDIDDRPESTRETFYKLTGLTPELVESFRDIADELPTEAVVKKDDPATLLDFLHRLGFGVPDESPEVESEIEILAE